MQRHIAQALTTVGGSSLQGAGKCYSMVCAIRCRVDGMPVRLIRRARLALSGRLHLRFSCLATRREHFPPTSLLSPLRHQVALHTAVLSLIIYASLSSEAPGRVGLFASFILIVRSFSIGDRKTSHRPASAREHAASNSVPFVAIARDQQLIICP